MDQMNSFGEWVQRRRKALDLTQAELAGLVACSVAAIRKIEADARRPSKSTADLLATALEIADDERSRFMQVARREISVIRSPAAVEQPPSTARPSSNSHLPTSSTAMIGREPELAQLLSLFAQPACRLLTIVGPGGIGKTRLALALAADQQAKFADGVHFVALAPLTAPDFIVSAIANALGLTFAGSVEPKTQLLHYLPTKNLLLVLDNIEHLLDDLSLLSAILQVAPQVKLLITSREQLNIQGEWILDLQGLPIPPPMTREDGVKWAELGDYSAVALFMERASQVRVDFALDDSNGADVIRICQLVEGMPLALELAAAWVHMLSCGEIAAEIARNMDFLEASWRDMPARHHSLRATFDYSWQLLTAEEQAVMRQLSVLRGGFTREAARRVGGATLPVLAALITKSLVRRATQERYDLHEIVRQYSADRLEAGKTAETVAVKQQHLDFYLQLAETFAAHYLGPQLAIWLERIAQDNDNFRAALEFSFQFASEKALRLTAALHSYWFHSAPMEGIDWMRKALVIAQAQTPVIAPVVRVNALLKATHLLEDQALNARLARTALALAQSIPDEILIAESLRSIAVNIWQAGQMAEAIPLFEESIRLFALHSQQSELYDTLALYANALRYYGNYAQTNVMLAHSLQTARAMDNGLLIGHALNNMGVQALYQGDLTQARTLMEEGVRVFKAAGSKRGLAVILRNLGRVVGYQGDTVLAIHHLQTVIALGQEMAWPGADFALVFLGELAYFQGELVEAANYLARAQTQFLDDQQTYTLILLFQGCVAWANQDFAQATQRLAESLQLAAINQRRTQLLIWHAQGLLHLSQQKWEDARLIFSQSLLDAHALGDQISIARSVEGLAAVALYQAESVADKNLQSAHGLRLFGAAEAIRAQAAAPLPPIERREYSARWDRARAQLGTAFDQAWSTGRSLPLAEMITLAKTGMA